MLGAPLNCGQHLCSIFQGVLAKCYQAFDRLVVRSQGVGDVLGTPLNVALGPLDHLLLQLEEFRHLFFRGRRMCGMPTISGLLVTV